MPDRVDRLKWLQQRLRTEGPQIMRILVAAAVAWQICVWLGATQPPIFAAVVPLVALRDHPYSAFNLSFDRLVGVFVGVTLAVLVVGWLGPTLPAVLLVLAVGLLIGTVLRVGAVLNVQIAVSGMLVLVEANVGSYAFARIWETAIGALVSVALSPLLFPPNARKAFESELQGVTDGLVAVLRSLAETLSRPGRPDDEEIRGLAGEAAALEERARRLPDSLAAARRAVQYNPLRRADRAPLADLDADVRSVVNMTRTERLLVDEVDDLSSRSDLQSEWPSLASSARAVVEPLIDAVRSRRGSDPEGPTAEMRTAVDAAWTAMLRWKDADPRLIGAVLRRPLVRLLHLLEEGSQPGAASGAGGWPERWPR